MRADRTGGMRGFTLIELMIVLVILGILSMLAWPAWTDYVRRSWRAEARTALLELAQAMERHRQRTLSYEGTWQGTTLPAPPLTSLYPTDRVPVDGGGGARYLLRIQQADGTRFEIRAIPQGDQLQDDCGTLILDHTGFRHATSGQNCW